MNIRESKEIPGLFTAGCQNRKDCVCVDRDENTPRNSFKFRWAQGIQPWIKNFFVEGEMPRVCCEDLPAQAKKYGKAAPEVFLRVSKNDIID